MRLDYCTINLTHNLLWLPSALYWINLLIMSKPHYSGSLGRADHTHPSPSTLPSWAHLLWPISVESGMAVPHQGVLTLKKYTQAWLNQRSGGLESNNCLDCEATPVLPSPKRSWDTRNGGEGGEPEFRCQNPHGSPKDSVASSEFQGY